MIQFIRARFKLVCLICFLLTTGAGVLGLVKPGMVYSLTGANLDTWEQSKFFFQFGFLLVAVVGFWFLIIMMNPAGNKPLLALATAEKFIFVGFFFWSMYAGNLSFLFSLIAFGDLAMGAACLLYLVTGEAKPVGSTV